LGLQHERASRSITSLSCLSATGICVPCGIEAEGGRNYASEPPVYANQLVEGHSSVVKSSLNVTVMRRD
jgi:hypothetical protein